MTQVRKRIRRGLFWLAIVCTGAADGCSSTSSRQFVGTGGASGTAGSSGSSGMAGGSTAGTGAAGGDASGGTVGSAGAGASSGTLGSGGTVDSDGAVDGGGSAGSAGTAGTAGSVGTSELGARCTADSQCRQLSCVKQILVTGSSEQVPQGICSRSCTTSADCADRGGECHKVDASSAGFCVERCAFGSATADFPPDKCHGRPELACAPTTASASGSGICVPWCNGDVDCGAGSYCNPQTGFCARAAIPGGSTGEPCASGPCRGECANFADDTGQTASVCVDRCTLRSPNACGGTTPPAAAGCSLVSPAVTAPGTGDAAHCLQLCDCTSQCKNPDFKCINEGKGDPLGRKGVCFFMLPGYTEVKTCS